MRTCTRNSFFGSPGWLATSAAVGLTGIKLDSLLAAGAFKAGADGGPGLWALTKMGYPTQAPGWLDEATGMLYESAKFGKTGQALYAAHGAEAFTFEVLERLDADLAPMLIPDAIKAAVAARAAELGASVLLP